MRHLFRRLVVAALAFAVTLAVGCGSDKPNPDLKVPDVPPGGRDSKGPVATKPDPDRT